MKETARDGRLMRGEHVGRCVGRYVMSGGLQKKRCVSLLSELAVNQFLWGDLPANSCDTNLTPWEKFTSCGENETPVIFPHFFLFSTAICMDIYTTLRLRTSS